MGLVTPLHVGYGPSVPVSVSINGGAEWTSAGTGNDNSDSELRFVYHPPLVLGSLSPLFGPAIGGTLVTVSLSATPAADDGENAATTTTTNKSVGLSSKSAWTFVFDPIRDTLTKCFFNGTSVPASVVSNTSIECVTPPTLSAGGVSFVQVSVNGIDLIGVSSKSRIADLHQGDALRFVYVPDENVMSLFPATGPVKGGTAVMVSGRHIADAAAALFALEASEYARNDGEANVSTLNEQYSLLLSPSSVSCSFGGEPAVAASGLSFDWGGVVDATARESGVGHVLCVSPPAASGLPSAAAVEVSLNGGQDFTHSGPQFYYRPEAHVFSVEPTYGPVSGGTPVRIEGGPFRNEGGACAAEQLVRCRFGDQEVGATVHSTTLIGCKTPPLPTVPEQQDIEVRLVFVLTAAVISRSTKFIGFRDCVNRAYGRCDEKFARGKSLL